MNNELYRKCLLPARESLDGETPTLLIVTEENNGFGVWLTNCEDRQKLLKWKDSREEAIEEGVFLADEIMIAQAQKAAA
jgi:hypothetical protein